jgi:hypothetical protein
VQAEGLQSLGPATRRVVVALATTHLLFCFCVFRPRLVHAHTPGLSTAVFEVQGDGRVDARLVFATAEPLRGTPLDPQDLGAFVLDGVDVQADGERCQGTFRGARVTEVDGLVLDASYACSPGAGEVVATLYYLGDLSPGHREIARISAGSATSEAVLTSDRRAIALRLPAGLRGGAPRQKGRPLAMVTPVLAAVLSLASVASIASILVLWRGRALRERKE